MPYAHFAGTWNVLWWLFVVFWSMVFALVFLFPMDAIATSVKAIVCSNNQIKLDQVEYDSVSPLYFYLFFSLSAHLFHFWTRNPNKCLQYKSLFNVSNARTYGGKKRPMKRNWQRAYRILFIFFFQIISSFTLCSPELARANIEQSDSSYTFTVAAIIWIITEMVFKHFHRLQLRLWYWYVQCNGSNIIKYAWRYQHRS